jgi:hypothetical protein
MLILGQSPPIEEIIVKRASSGIMSTSLDALGLGPLLVPAGPSTATSKLPREEEVRTMSRSAWHRCNSSKRGWRRQHHSLLPSLGWMAERQSSPQGHALENLVSTLADKCNKLASRLERAENELAVYRSGACGPELPAHPCRGIICESCNENEEDAQENGAGMDVGFEAVRETIMKLHSVYSNSHQLLETRMLAAAKLQAFLRGAVVRRRLSRFSQALGRWRVSHSLPVLQCLRKIISRQKGIHAATDALRRRSSSRLIQSCFLNWIVLLRQGQLHRERGAILQRHLLRERESALKASVFRSLWSGTLGPRSRRELARRNRERAQAAREALQRRLEGGLLVTADMVRVEMNREAVRTMGAYMDLARKRRILNVLKDAVAGRQQLEAQAHAVHASRVTRRILVAWRRWAFLTSEGLQRHMLDSYRGIGGLRYNARAVERFERVRTLRGVFAQWSRGASKLVAARTMRRRHDTDIAKAVLAGWRTESTRIKRVRELTISAWEQHSMKNLCVPFRAWYIYTDDKKRLYRDQERLALMYRRSALRRIMYRILKAWNHQAVYGRIDGLYTRPQLMASLAEQKDHSAKLIAHLNDAKNSLAEMEASCNEYRGREAMQLQDIAERDATISQLRMAIHGAEQDMVRLRGQIKVLSELAPALVSAVQRIAPDESADEGGGYGYSLDELAAKVDAGSEVDVEGDRPEGVARRARKSKRAAPLEVADAATQVHLAELFRSFPTSGHQLNYHLAADTLAMGVKPPTLPRELERLDRVDWVLAHAGLDRVVQSMEVEMAQAKHEREKRFAELDLEVSASIEAIRSARFQQQAETELLADREVWGSLDSDDPEVLEQRAMAAQLCTQAAIEERLARESLQSANELSGISAIAMQELKRVVGLVEFMRTGNENSLSPPMRTRWGERGGAGLPLLCPGSAAERPRSLTWSDLCMALETLLPPQLGNPIPSRGIKRRIAHDIELEQKTKGED